jgi:hypothetical protein
MRRFIIVVAFLTLAVSAAAELIRTGDLSPLQFGTNGFVRLTIDAEGAVIFEPSATLPVCNASREGGVLYDSDGGNPAGGLFCGCQGGAWLPLAGIQGNPGTCL